MASYAYNRLGGGRQGNGRSTISIAFNNHPESHAYTTHDTISGTVAFTPSRTQQIDQVLVALEGKSESFVHIISPVASETKVQATHTFLRLLMPFEDTDYPEDRLVQAGETYIFPFTFVVPEQLLPIACTHTTKGPHVQEAHLRLPPSMGEEATPKPRADDLAPSMAKVSYYVQAKVLAFNNESPTAASSSGTDADGTPVALAEIIKKLDILPAIPEAPPLHIVSGDPASDDYNLSASKSIRKGLLKGKLGTISVWAAQPRALLLQPASPDHNTIPTARTTLHLRFDPADPTSSPQQHQLPKLGSVTTKIRAMTFHAVKPMTDLASRAELVNLTYDAGRNMYHTTVSLATRSNVDSAVSWTYIPPVKDLSPAPRYMRRDSGYSTASTRSSSSSSDPASSGSPTIASQDKRGYYTATLTLPISLPGNKTWLPTFHSCLVSRVYSLALDVAVAAPGGSAGLTSTLALRLPIQIASSPRLSRPAASLESSSSGGTVRAGKRSGEGSGSERDDVEEGNSELEREREQELLDIAAEVYEQLHLGPRPDSAGSGSSDSSGAVEFPSRRRSDDEALPPEYDKVRRARRGERVRS